METITITMVRMLRVRMRNAPVAPIIKTLLIIVDATVGDCSEQSESFIHRLPSSYVTDGLRIQSHDGVCEVSNTLVLEASGSGTVDETITNKRRKCHV